MLGHLLKLMWNKRRSNGLIFLEILLAFIVLFGVYGFALYNYDRYSSPLGFSYEHSIGIRLDIEDEMDSLDVLKLQDNILRQTNEIPGVVASTFIGPVNPFGGSNWGMGNEDNGFPMFSRMFFADEHFAETMQLEFREGRWFEERDKSTKYEPIVVNGYFKDEYYPNAETLVDSIIFLGGEKQVIGVVEDFKYASNFVENEALTFFPQRSFYIGPRDPFEMMIVRTAPGQTAAVEEPIYNLLTSLTKNTDVVIWNMAEDRIKANRPVVIPLVILIIISSFLLINIALGLFGVLFTQINRRRAEIGLRKAMGATPGEVTAQFVGEVVIVTLAGLLLGTFFAVQVPLLELLPIPGKFFYFAIAAAIVTILLIVTLCALVPSRQAARLHPALVLHEE